MVARIKTVSFRGVDVLDIDVEVQISSGFVAFTNVGYIKSLICALLFFSTSIGFSNSSFAQNGKEEMRQCVHWTTPLVFEEFYPRAAIRKAIKFYKANPDLCKRPDLKMGEECAPTTGKIRAEEIRILQICGDWALIGYREQDPKSRYKIISGWVQKKFVHELPFNDEDIVKQQRFSIKDTALTKVIKSGEIKAIENLLRDSNHPEYLNQALSLGIHNSNSNLVHYLLEKGASPIHGPWKCFPAIKAVNNNESLKAVIQAGYDVNCQDNNGHTALMNLADRIRIGKFPHTELFADSVTPAETLIKSGADLEIKNKRKMTALRLTLQRNSTDLAAYLLKEGADPNNYLDDSTAIGTQMGYSILMEAIHWYPLTWDPTMIKLLLENGADVNYRTGKYDGECDRTTKGKCTFQGQTALTRAAQDGYFTIVRLLLDNGADPLKVRGDRKSPAEIAKKNGHNDIAEYIQNFIKKSAVNK